MTTAVSALVDHAFGEWDLHRLVVYGLLAEEWKRGPAAAERQRRVE
jgi:hypothetical protein